MPVFYLTDFADFRGFTTGDDTVFAYRGSDYLFLNFGNDIAFAGRGHDTVIGGYGADTIYGDDGHDLIYGGNLDGVGRTAGWPRWTRLGGGDSVAAHPVDGSQRDRSAGCRRS